MYVHIPGFCLIDVPVHTCGNRPKPIPGLGGFGMEFGLHENITQLARRNDKSEAFQLLLTLEPWSYAVEREPCGFPHLTGLFCMKLIEIVRCL